MITDRKSHAGHPLHLWPSRSRLCREGFEGSQRHNSPSWVELGLHDQNLGGHLQGHCEPHPPLCWHHLVHLSVPTHLDKVDVIQNKAWGSRPVAIKRPRHSTSEPWLGVLPMRDRGSTYNCAQFLAGLPQFGVLPHWTLTLTLFPLNPHSRHWPSSPWSSAGPLHLNPHIISPVVWRSISPSDNQQQWYPSTYWKICWCTFHEI